MNEKHIEDIITALYDLVQDARAVPLASDKCILERDKVLDMLDEDHNPISSCPHPRQRFYIHVGETMESFDILRAGRKEPEGTDKEERRSPEGK